MKAKLIKTEGLYILKDGLLHVVGVDDKNLKERLNCNYLLFTKNCQAIERGYDLDELIAKKVNDFNIVDKAVEFSNANSKNNGAYLAYIAGAYEMAKQLEILGDKKFSEADVISMIEKSRETGLTAEYLILNNQQTEWDVVVEMEDIYDGLDEMAQPQYHKQPKLDADGNLILKRV